MRASMYVLMPALLAIAWLPGCDQPVEPPMRNPAQAVAPAMPAEESTPPTRIVFLGDSLTAGYGLEASQAFPAIIEQKLKGQGLAVRVVNAGISGDTTAGGLRRLDWLLKQKPDIVVVGLGGNDGLRGLDLSASENNLRQIIQKCHDAGAQVLLLGMLIPPNYGPTYTAQFRDLYRKLAGDGYVTLLPFLLEGVGGDPSLNLPDGIHPNEAGQQIVASNVLPLLKPMVEASLAK